MDYVDQHHKRISFTAAEFSVETHGSGQQLTFVEAGKSGQKQITVIERGTVLAAVIEGANQDFILRKIQILERSHRLTLDFAENTTLRRVSIDIEKLDADAVDVALKRMVTDRALLYFRH